MSYLYTVLLQLPTPCLHSSTPSPPVFRSLEFAQDFRLLQGMVFRNGSIYRVQSWKVGTQNLDHMFSYLLLSRADCRYVVKAKWETVWGPFSARQSIAINYSLYINSTENSECRLTTWKFVNFTIQLTASATISSLSSSSGLFGHPIFPLSKPCSLLSV